MARRERELEELRQEPAIGDLVRDFSQDAATLVRQEIALAKAELKETAADYARDSAKLALAGVIGWFGAMALAAALVIGLSALLDNYWLGALIVAVVLLAAGAVLGSAALKHLRRTPPKPQQAIDNLQEDQRWARRELQDFKRHLKG